MEGDWNSAGVILNNEAKALERGGADVIVLATNTMHKLASEMMTGVKIPFVHIADATARACPIAAGTDSSRSRLPRRAFG